MPTPFDALDALYPLSPDNLHNQWLLTRDSAVMPETWSRQTLGEWRLAYHSTALVASLKASDQTRIGWVISPLYYRDASGTRFPENSLTLPVGPEPTIEEVEKALYGRDERGFSDGSGLQGSWTTVVFGGPASGRFGRVYVAPNYSVVYDPASRSVASTPNPIPGLRRDAALSAAFDPLAKNTYYSFGLTAFRGVRRLMPNHCLDLGSFETQRHWPRAPLEPVTEGRLGAAALVEEGRRAVEALGTRFDSFQVFLSAGRDSRAVLAMARPLVEQGKEVRLSTTYGDDIESRTDLQAARRLARIAGLPHEVKRKQPAPSGDRCEAFARLGEARAGSVLSWPRGANAAGSERFKLAGMAGELGRAYYWRSLKDRGPTTAEALAKRLKAPRIPAVLAAAQAWLDGLPQEIRSSAAATYDLAYIEQRLGCWAAPVRYLTEEGGRQTSLSPMASALGLEIMLRLPEAYREAGRLQEDMVACGWPELAKVPYNRPVGLLKWEKRGARVLGKVATAWRSRASALPANDPQASGPTGPAISSSARPPTPTASKNIG